MKPGNRSPTAARCQCRPRPVGDR